MICRQGAIPATSQLAYHLPIITQCLRGYVPKRHDTTNDPKDERYADAIDGVDDGRRGRVYTRADHTVDNEECGRPCPQLPVLGEDEIVVIGRGIVVDGRAPIKNVFIGTPLGHGLFENLWFLHVHCCLGLTGRYCRAMLVVLRPLEQRAANQISMSMSLCIPNSLIQPVKYPVRPSQPSIPQFNSNHSMLGRRSPPGIAGAMQSKEKTKAGEVFTAMSSMVDQAKQDGRCVFKWR